MRNEDQISDLLDAWEQAQERGQPIAAEDLCRDAPHLLDELSRRIQKLQRLGSVISPTSSEDDALGLDRLVAGKYRLIRQIGEGGFGLVYLAEQQRPMRRDVALKILKPGMDSRRVLRRFDAERQSLAVMDHPHIARVYDGGATDAGHPFFVM